MYKRILVPIDGSDTARRGLQEGIALAADQKATLFLLHVTSDFTIIVEQAHAMDIEKLREGLQQFGRDLLDEAKKQAQSQGVVAEAMLVDLDGGHVSEVIVAEARRVQADLIVIGTHGRRGFSRAVMGSDAEAVVREATVPVLLIRAANARN